jgi:hypothetical protein
MKKIATILVLVFAFTLTAQAQKKGGKNKAEKMLKKMTADLSLTEEQQNKIKPLLVAQIADRKLMSENRKARKESGKKPSKKERKKMRKERMEKETAMNSEMENILNDTQFAKFEMMAKERKDKAKNKRKKDNK